MAAHDHRPARFNPAETSLKPIAGLSDEGVLDEPDINFAGESEDEFAAGLDPEDAAWQGSATDPSDEIWDSLELDDEEPEPDEGDFWLERDDGGI